MKLTIVGSASGMPAENISSSCYWLEYNNTVVLLDCGDGAAQALLKAKLDPLKIGAIAISHTHSDHWTGFVLLIQFFHLMQRTAPLTVFASARALRMLKYILDMSYMWQERIGFEIIWQKFNDQKTAPFADFTLVPHFNSHLEGYRNDLLRHPLCELDSFSIEVITQNSRGIYSGDIGELSDLDPLLVNPVKWLLIEGMHFTLENFKPWCESKNIEKVIVTHIQPAREDEIFWNAIKATDGMTIEL